jgi:hypothetical protein
MIDPKSEFAGNMKMESSERLGCRSVILAPQAAC